MIPEEQTITLGEVLASHPDLFIETVNGQAVQRYYKDQPNTLYVHFYNPEVRQVMLDVDAVVEPVATSNHGYYSVIDAEDLRRTIRIVYRSKPFLLKG